MSRLTKNDLVDRLAEAIGRRIPDVANHKSWFRKQALDLGIPYETFRNHATGEHECSGSVLLSYFAHFGPEFEREVRGGDEAAGANADADLGRKVRLLVEGKAT